MRPATSQAVCVIEELGAIPVASTAAELLASCEARVTSANHRLRQFAESRGGAVVGTTLAALLMFEAFYAGVWSGDSRIYLIRNNRIEQVSLDHTEVQELISEGALTADEAGECRGAISSPAPLASTIAPNSR